MPSGSAECSAKASGGSGVIAGLADPAIRPFAKRVDPLVTRAFTPVFDELCRQVTDGVVDRYHRDMFQHTQGDT
jgi:hypothetical protein